MKSIDKNRHEIPKTGRLIDQANQDSDAVSLFVLGDSLTENQGAIMVIKGALAFNRVRNFCVQEGLLTPGKPVVDNSTAG